MFDFVHIHFRLHFKTLLEFHACDWLSEPQYSQTRTVFLHSKHLFVAGKATVSGHLTLTPLLAAHENNSCEQLAPVSDTLFASQGCPLTRTSTVLKINYERFKPFNEVTFLIFSSLTLMLFCHMISKRKLDKVERLERMFKDVWVWYPV